MCGGISNVDLVLRNLSSMISRGQLLFLFLLCSHTCSLLTRPWTSAQFIIFLKPFLAPSATFNISFFLHLVHSRACCVSFIATSASLYCHTDLYNLIHLQYFHTTRHATCDFAACFATLHGGALLSPNLFPIGQYMGGGGKRHAIRQWVSASWGRGVG